MANRKRAITLSLLAMVAVMTVMAEMVIWPQSVRGRREERRGCGRRPADTAKDEKQDHGRG
jgi:hypothetical protein